MSTYSLLSNFKSPLRLLLQRTRSEVFRLALLVRRGEEIVVDSDRMLANTYYVSCALRFCDSLKKQHPIRL